MPIDATQLDAIDAEIRSVFPPEDIITPDEVRGTHPTLEDAVLTDGWPTLGQTRGRSCSPSTTAGPVQDDYLAGHPSLEGRVMFSTGSEPGHPETAVIKYNDPVGDFTKIQSAVAAGYIVRPAPTPTPSRSTPTCSAPRPGPGQRRPVREHRLPGARSRARGRAPRAHTPYFVAIPGGTPARCNPISAPVACAATDVENPAWLQAEPDPAPPPPRPSRRPSPWLCSSRPRRPPPSPPRPQFTG